MSNAYHSRRVSLSTRSIHELIWSAVFMVSFAFTLSTFRFSAFPKAKCSSASARSFASSSCSDFNSVVSITSSLGTPAVLRVHSNRRSAAMNQCRVNELEEECDNSVRWRT